MIATLEKEVQSPTLCYHCGQPCRDEIKAHEKVFCCAGCQAVFEILSENNLCQYYSLDEKAGVSMRERAEGDFAYLDVPEIRKKLLSFESKEFARVSFHAPAIHCVSCIWLLENLQKLGPGVLKSEVNFAQKKVAVDFNPDKIKLSVIASLMASIGYAPRINLEAGAKNEKKVDRALVIKLALAGFCFGNVMLFSFPEYLGMDGSDHVLMRTFSWLNLVLSLPVFFYSAMGYLVSAFRSFRQRQINIDVPIAAGLIALFFRSSYDIITASGPGYLDSFSGLVFFLLIGRWFQAKTYESLAFDRDFKSYFPLAVKKEINGVWIPTIIYDLNPGDRIQIRNMEIIPADGVLENPAHVDYSFVTGESKPVSCAKDTIVYAGGRLTGQPVTVLVQKKTSQSDLTTLWNHAAFSKVPVNSYQKIIDESARKFTWIVMAIALATAAYWQWYHPGQMWLVLTSVLMVACPCALALAAPFTYGNMQRVFGRNEFYLKHSDVVERLASVDAIVFDKTGTITHGSHPEVKFVGKLTPWERSVIASMTAASTHPLSKIIHEMLQSDSNACMHDFKERAGKGIEAVCLGRTFRVGSGSWLNATPIDKGTTVFVSVDKHVIGYFLITTSIRANIKETLHKLKGKTLSLVSGDDDGDKAAMSNIFGNGVSMLFHQSPQEKLEFVKTLQGQGKKVLMVGDGLNDAGALKQADVGIAVTDDTGVFTPSCDGILKGSQLVHLDKFIELANAATRVLKVAFSISFFYNAISLTFAVTGNLSPLVAAVLMPLSSISVVGFSFLGVKWVSKRILKSDL